MLIQAPSPESKPERPDRASFHSPVRSFPLLPASAQPGTRGGACDPHRLRHRIGCQYVSPVQAKGGNDQLSTVQAKQDIACCAEKFPNLVCRAISAQFIDDSRIAMFELQLDEDGLVRTAEERHYRLVSADQITESDMAGYRQRAGN